MLIRSIKTIVKEPSKIKTLANFRKHVFSALENYLCNSKGISRKLICAGLNIGYVLFKKDHVPLTQPALPDNTVLPDKEYYLTDLLPLSTLGSTRSFKREKISCTVVVPVYNGLDHLKRLLPSLVENTNKDVHVLIINDNSPDKHVNDFLKKYEAYPNFCVLTNSENLGFVGTINKAMSMVKTDFAVWLNSDTDVPNFWIERLLAPFEKHPKLATATPFSNSAVTFSYPDFGVDNELKFPLKEIDEAFQKIEPTESQMEETYSGTGYCMAINMECWKDVGELDIEAFGKGYGEENDWCMRASLKGWHHKLVNNLFVHHSHGGSFLSEEKKALCERNRKILISRYPKIMLEEVPQFFQQDPWKPFRQLASLFLSNKNLTLFIDLKKKTNDISGALDYLEVG